MRAATEQRELFGAPGELPASLDYRPQFLSRAEEESLLAEIRALPLEEARYRSFTAKRRIASFGAGYDFETNALLPAPPLPAFLLPLRRRIAAWVDVRADDLVQCNV